jgi:hypothetical protein
MHAGAPFNPWFDPFVEAGYRGYSLKAAARRGFHRTFAVTLEIRDNRAGALFYGLIDELIAQTSVDALSERLW